MSQGRPFYFRILRVRHLVCHPALLILLFEGSIAFAVLLAFADLVSLWGILAIPITVALAVKLQDIIAGTFIRPLAFAQLRTPRPGEATAVGRSPVPRPSHLTTWIDGDDAVADSAAQPSPGPDDGDRPVARGVAAVPEANRINGRRPLPGVTGEHRLVEPVEPLESFEVTGDSFDVNGQADRDATRGDGADGRSRGNQGRFTG